MPLARTAFACVKLYVQGLCHIQRAFCTDFAHCRKYVSVLLRGKIVCKQQQYIVMLFSCSRGILCCFSGHSLIFSSGKQSFTSWGLAASSEWSSYSNGPSIQKFVSAPCREPVRR